MKKINLLKNSVVPSIKLSLFQFIGFNSMFLIIKYIMSSDRDKFFSSGIDLLIMVSLISFISLLMLQFRFRRVNKALSSKLEKISFEQNAKISSANLLMVLSGNFNRVAIKNDGTKVRAYCFSKILKSSDCSLIKHQGKYYAITL